MEIELKLSLEPGAAGALRAHPLIAHYRQGRPWARDVENHYFDTPALDLQRRGIELRLRREGSRCLQTLKVLQSPGARAPGGLHRLEEWEVPLRRAALDMPALLGGLPASAAAAAEHLRAAAAQDGFGVRLETRFRRTTWALLSVRGDRVELALDIGEIHAGGHSMPLCEVELELKGGEERALFELAHALQASLPLRPELRGKAERGFALLAPQPPAPARTARAPRVARNMPWAGVLRAIVEECLAQLQANEAGVVGSTDVEYVHQMRVGLRRLRSALGLFKEFAVPPQAVLDDLRWIAERLGQARDAEVLAHETLPRVPEPAGACIDWPALHEAAAVAAGRARALAVQAVRTPRHVGWQLAMMAWVCGLPGTAPLPGAGPAEEGEDPLPAYAQRRLKRLRKRLVRDGKQLQGADATARHDARIVAKKLRYATEMLGALQHGRKRHDERQGLRSLAALQQQLGLLNDAEVAAGLLAALAAGSPRLAPAASYAQGWLAAEAEQRVRQLGRIWRRVLAAL